MSTAAGQFSTANKANLETNLTLFVDFTNKTFAGVEKLIDLNISAAKASLEESNITAHKLFAAKDMQEFFSLSAALAQPRTETAIVYGRHFASIASSTQVELAKIAEAQVAATNRQAIEFVEQVSKKIPLGSEGAVAFAKSAINSVSAGYEQFAKNAKQAVETLEDNVNNAVDQLSHAASKNNGNTTKK